MADLTAVALQHAFATGSRSVIEVTAQCIDRCQQDRHNAIITVSQEAAGAAQASAERYRLNTEIGPWDGMPFVAKDNIAVADLPWTAGIEAYRQRLAKHDAHLITWLKQQGAIMVGKANLHEAALGTSTNNPWFGQCHHPQRHGFSPGGSSGGSAVAVAANYVPLALGTDTMGSVRIPAAICGIYGYKPTNGLLSDNGVTPLSRLLDTIGLIAATAADLEIYGSSLVNIDSTHSATATPNPLIGVLSDYALSDCSSEVTECYHNAVDLLNRYDISTVEVNWFDNPTQNRRAGLTLCVDEAYREHKAALEENPEGFSSDLIGLLTFGRNLDPAKLATAKEQIAHLQSYALKHWSAVDLIMTPASSRGTHSFNEAAPVDLADFTAAANLIGAPSTALPWGQCSYGLPLGLQLIGKRGRDKTLLSQTSLIDDVLRR